MAKNANFVSHKKSKQIVDGKPKLPLASDIVEGEIAINFGKDVETLSIKNESGDVVTFSSDNYYTEQKLGSSFTGENSGVTVTDTILWVSGSGVNSAVLKGGGSTASGICSVAEGAGSNAIGNYSHAEGHATASGDTSHAEGTGQAIGSHSHAEGFNTIANNDSEHASGQYNVSSSASTTFGDSGNTLFSVGNGTADDARHNAFEIRQNGDIYITSGGTDILLQDNLGRNIEIDQVIDSGTSASTNAVATKAVVDKLIEDEQVWAISLNELNNKKFGYSNFDSTDSTLYFYKNEDDYTSGGTAIDSVDLSDISIEIDQVIDDTTSASTGAVSTSAVYGFVTSYTPSITVDQVLDDTTSASTNPVSSKAVYDAVTDNELVWTNAYVALSGTVSAHTANTEIHVTAADRAKLNSITGTVGTMAYEDTSSYSSATEINTALGNKADTSDLSALSGTVTAHTADTDIHITSAERTEWNSKLDTSDIADFFDDAKYEDSGTSKVINFYHGNTVKATINADDFIKDGMISGVTLESKSGTTYLVINWNTDAGIQTTELNIGDIFEADNYYNKTEIDNKLGSAFTGSNSGVTITEYIENNEEVTSAALNDLYDTKLDSSAYTPVQIDQVIDDTTSASTDAVSTSAVYEFVTSYAPSITVDPSLDPSSNNPVANSAITEVIYENERVTSEALNYLNTNKQNVLSAGTGILISGNVISSTASITVDPSLDPSSNNPVANSAITTAINSKANSSDVYTKSQTSGSTQLSTEFAKYYTKSQTSGATELATAFANVQIDIDQVIDSGTSASTDAVSTNAVYGFVTDNFYTKDEIDNGDYAISASLNDLNTRKLDTSAFTEHSSNTNIHLLQIVSAVTVSSDMSNVTCPDSITGVSNNGAQALVIYENDGYTTDYTITVSSSYKSPDGSQITMTCPRNGYCEVSYVNINGTIYVRGI